MSKQHPTSAERVAAFHRAIGHPVLDTPQVPPQDRRTLRLNLVIGETAELICALVGIPDSDEEAHAFAKTRMHQMVLDLMLIRPSILHDPNRPYELDNIARQAVDVHVVVSGTCLEYGLPEDEVYEEVQRANMAKVGGPTRADGKQLRPEGWQPPDVMAVLRRHGLTPPWEDYVDEQGYA